MQFRLLGVTELFNGGSVAGISWVQSPTLSPAVRIQLLDCTCFIVSNCDISADLHERATFPFDQVDLTRGKRRVVEVLGNNLTR